MFVMSSLVFSFELCVSVIATATTFPPTTVYTCTGYILLLLFAIVVLLSLLPSEGKHFENRRMLTVAAAAPPRAMRTGKNGGAHHHHSIKGTLQLRFSKFIILFNLFCFFVFLLKKHFSSVDWQNLPTSTVLSLSLAVWCLSQVQPRAVLACCVCYRPPARFIYYTILVVWWDALIYTSLDCPLSMALPISSNVRAWNNGTDRISHLWKSY